MATLRAVYERLDGVFLPGGVDMDPQQYGESRMPVCGVTDPDRDRVEVALVRWAMEERKPVLAVCRGVQVLNVAAGGTLYQDLAEWCDAAIKHDYWPNEPRQRQDLVHEVLVEPAHAARVDHGRGTRHGEQHASSGDQEARAGAGRECARAGRIDRGGRGSGRRRLPPGRAVASRRSSWRACRRRADCSKRSSRRRRHIRSTRCRGRERAQPMLHP